MSISASSSVNSSRIQLHFAPFRPAWKSLRMAQTPAYTRARRALELGLSALQSMQEGDGSFPLFQRSEQTAWRACGPLFSTLSVLLAAGSMMREGVRMRAVDFVYRNRRRDGLWEFDPTFGIPPDADDTACALTVAARHDRARVNASDAALLRSFWRTDGGPFQSWRGDKSWSGRDRDDAVVNCNVVLALQELGAPASAQETKAVLDLIRASEAGCRYYCSPITIAYAARRAGLSLATLPASLAARPSAEGLLPTAQWLSLCRRWDEDAVERVLAAQTADGSWPIEAWFTGAGTPKPVWGSQAISTALCLEALKEAIDSAVASAKERKTMLPASDAIDKGEAYLLDRIRAEELVSRAPATSPDKRLDNCGEALLAIDTLIAVGDRVEASDRRKFAARLLALRSNGAWNYSGSGVDADSTASAIRALDRLGESVSLDCLQLFYDPRSRLFNTFAPSSDNLDLQLPPQSATKHLGAHPCVLANVCLLLQERRQLSHLSHDLLRRMQRPDGLWFSYFYPSPFYSTRLFTELLTALGEPYDNYVRSTANALLACDPPSSPTQVAEILISLMYLQHAVRDDMRINERATALMPQLLASQLVDGSWPGETIWQFHLRSRPLMTTAFDHFRVRSTALCVRALKLWASSEHPEASLMSRA
jgi:hypothetical protein